MLVASCVARNGLDGMFLATIMAGVFLRLIGGLRLGSYIEFIPYPVTVGFISGIAVILFIGQIGDLLGLHLASNPADILPKLEQQWVALPTFNMAALAVALGSIGTILGLRRIAPQLPGILIAVVLGALAVWLLKLPITGFALGTLLFIHRMAETASVEAHVPALEENRADETDRPYDPSVAADPDVAIYRITGAFFFGAAASVAAVLDRIADRHRAFILDFSAVPFIDSTAANAIEGLARKAERSGVRLVISAPHLRSGNC